VLDGTQAGRYPGSAGGDGLTVASAVGVFGEGLGVALDFADVGFAFVGVGCDGEDDGAGGGGVEDEGDGLALGVAAGQGDGSGFVVDEAQMQARLAWNSRPLIDEKRRIGVFVEDTNEIPNSTRTVN
jgi:hypothetical protein